MEEPRSAASFSKVTAGILCFKTCLNNFIICVFTEKAKTVLSRVVSLELTVVKADEVEQFRD